MMKIERTVYWEDLRNACIREEWYTKGTCEEYDNLLFGIVDKCSELTDEKLMAIAEDIFQHSNTEKLMDKYGCDETEYMEHILWVLLNEVANYNVEIER